MNVVFEEEGHTYTNTETSELYISATTLLRDYHEPFDSIGAATRVSKREGVEMQFILDLWQRQNDEANVKGTFIHKIIEDHLTGQLTRDHPKILKLVKQFDAIQKDHVLPRYTEIHSEKVLWNHDHKLAGMADIIYDYKDGFIIGDIKTNKKFNFYSAYNDYMRAPVGHLHHCQFNEYCLQLSLYAFMREELTQTTCKGLVVYYYDPTLSDFVAYHLNYMKPEIELLITPYTSRTIKS